MTKEIRVLKIFATILITATLLGTTAINALAADVNTMFVTPLSGLNIRTENSIESDKLGALPYNSEVQVIGMKDNWAKVRYDDKEAYMCADYLADNKQDDIEEYSTLADGTYLGTFTLSHYCACSICCGWSTGITASGTYATAGRTVGVDTSVIPFGTHLLINGVEYIAEDTGSGVNGNWIDIFCSSHDEALSRGLQTADVYIIE